MPLVSGRDLLEVANYHSFAIPAFSVHTFDILDTVLRVAEEEESPVFVHLPGHLLNQRIVEPVAGLVGGIRNNYRIPFAIALEGAGSIDQVLLALRCGLTLVILDLSGRTFKESVEFTRKVVSLCTPLGVSVEAGLLGVRGGPGSVYERFYEFALRTGVDCLTLPLDRIREDPGFVKEVKGLTNMPLSVGDLPSLDYQYLVEIRKYGGEVEEMEGFSDTDLSTLFSLGINKISTDTDLRLAFTAALRRTVAERRSLLDPTSLIRPILEELKEVIRRRIRSCGSSGKATLWPVW